MIPSASFLLSVALGCLLLCERSVRAQDACDVAYSQGQFCDILDLSCGANFLNRCTSALDAPAYCSEVSGRQGINIWAQCFSDKCKTSTWDMELSDVSNTFLANLLHIFAI